MNTTTSEQPVIPMVSKEEGAALEAKYRNGPRATPTVQTGFSFAPAPKRQIAAAPVDKRQGSLFGGGR